MDEAQRPAETARTVGEMATVALLTGSRLLTAIRDAEAALRRGDVASTHAVLAAAAQRNAYDSVQDLLDRSLPRPAASDRAYG